LGIEDSEMEAEKFCLRWNDFETNISAGFRELRNEKDFFDVTLACDDSQVQAHKVILSACSPFFRNILRRNPHQHPLLYLKGVKYTELQSVLNFMYLGEVSVAQEELNSFLSVAEDLKVKGLTQNSPGKGSAKNISKPETYSQNKPRLPQAIVGPKRARIVEPTPPPPPPAVEDYHQEIVHVKSEPGADHQEQAQHAGTVAVDQSYSEADGYEEYPYEEGYQDVPVVGGQAGGFGSGAGKHKLLGSTKYFNPFIYYCLL
jgi:hypothetical protein